MGKRFPLRSLRMAFRLAPWFASPWRWTLLAALLFLAFDTAERVQRLRALTAVTPADLVLPAVDASTASGYAGGQRVVPFGYFDSYHWVRQTQEMVAAGDWRVRAVDYDHAPQGREVHWSAGLRWWLAGLGWIDHRLSGRPWGASIERMAPLSLPLSFGLLLLIGTPWIARQFGTAAATVFAPVAVACLPLAAQFGAEAPDHHGWVIACAVATVLFLAAGGAGWVGENEVGSRQGACPPTWSRARRRFILSGIAGGAGLWISAATQVPVLMAIGLAVLLAVRPGTAPRADVRLAPGLWRVWGVAGAGTSLAFYVLEYAPSAWGWRLEVNHPLYALAWWGAGELLAAIASGRVEPNRRVWRESWPRLTAATVALITLPVVMAVTAERTFWVADPMLWILHTDYIKEFRGLLSMAGQVPANRLLSVVNPLPLVILPLAWLALRRGGDGPARGAVWLAVAPAALLLAFAFWQVRWYGPACGLALGAMAVGLSVQSRAAGEWTWTARAAGVSFLLLIVAPYPAATWPEWLRTFRSGPKFAPHHLQELVARDVAHWLRARVGDDGPLVIASDPTTTTALIYFGNAAGLGTLYWENLPGLRAAVALGGADSDEAAREVARRHGVTHLVVMPDRPFAEESARLARNLRRDVAVPGYTFLRHLLIAPEPPGWLRQLPYPLPATASREGMAPVRVFEVVPEQSVAEATLRSAQFWLAAGDLAAATLQLRRAQVVDAEYLPVRIFAARLTQRQGAREEFGRRLEAVRAALPAGDALLALEDRVELLALLRAVGDEPAAREQLGAAAAQAGEAELRRLRPEALFELGEALRGWPESAAGAATILARIERILPRRTEERLLFAQAVRLQREFRTREAVALYRRQLALNPTATSAMANLAWVLAATTDENVRDPAAAAELARQAVALSEGRDLFALNALAAAQAAQGDFVGAERHVRAALALAEAAGRTELLPQLRTCLELYRAGRPVREGPPRSR